MMRMRSRKRSIMMRSCSVFCKWTLEIVLDEAI